MTPTNTASPGYIFRQNIQSLLQCLSSHATSTTTTNTNTSTTTIDTTQITANTGTTYTGTTHTTNTSTTTIGTTQTTTSTGTTYTHTGTTHTTNTRTTTIGTTQTSTNTGAAYTHTSTTHTTNTHTTTTTSTGTMYTHTGTTPATNTGTAQTIQVVNTSATAPSTSTTIAVPAIIGDDDDDRDLLSPAWDVNTHDRLQDVSLPESILLSSPIGSPGSPFSVMSLSPENRSSDGQETDSGNDVMDGSRVAIQVSEDMVALPASVTVQGPEVGEIIPCRIQRSSQVLSAFTGVQPEMFYAWQNEIYGWQHPNIITMPYELLRYQASQDLIPMIVYFSSNPAYDIHRDDFCRNILSDPDFIQACSNVYFWCIGDCPESTEIQRSLHVQQHAPLLVSVIHNASGAQMTPVVLTDLTSVQEVVAFIQTAVGVQQDQVQLRRSRELRTAQDAEYQASLEQDRARARQREEERAREEEIERERLIAEAQQRDQEERNREEEMERERLNVEANENAIREARAQLPAEPLESSDTVTIRLRGPRDQSVQRTFFHRDTTEVLYRAAFALLELPSQEFRLRLHAVIIENNGATLAEHDLGTTNSILLSVDM